MELEDEAELLIAEFGDRPLVHREQVAILEQHLPSGWPLEAAEHVKQRRFANAGLSDNRDLFARRNFQIEARAIP